jgi:hypothetical protein
MLKLFFLAFAARFVTMLAQRLLNAFGDLFARRLRPA